MLLFLLPLTFISCGDDDKEKDEPIPAQPGDELVGRWVQQDNDAPYILIFNSNKSGTISFTIGDDSRASLSFSQKFNWSVSTSSDGTTYCNILTISGDDILEDGRYDYILIRNSMNFGSLKFKKAN